VPIHPLRSPLLLSLALATLALIAGCSDDDDPSAPVGPDDPVPVAEMDYTMGHGSEDSTLTSLSITLRYEGDADAHLGPFVIEAGDTGRTIAIDASSSPTFASFVAHLVDGEDDVLHVDNVFNGHLATTSRTESQWLELTGGKMRGAILEGYEISGIDILVGEVAFTVPGIDPNGDGEWTDSSVSLHLSFWE